MARRSTTLDFNYTCPIIDRCITTSKELLNATSDELVVEIRKLYDEVDGGKIDDETLTDFINSMTEAITNAIDCDMDLIADEFETVRSTNEEMRSAADCQISELVDEIDDLESEIRNLEGS